MDGVGFEGDAILNTPEDVEQMQRWSAVSGRLSVGPSLRELHLPNVTSVGSIYIEKSTTLTRIYLPNLKRIQGELWLYLNAALTDVDLRHLEVVDERLFIHRNAELRNLQLSSLRSVHGSVKNPGNDGEISGNSKVPRCQLDVLSQSFTSFNVAGGVAGCTCHSECSVITADGC